MLHRAIVLVGLARDTASEIQGRSVRLEHQCRSPRCWFRLHCWWHALCAPSHPWERTVEVWMAVHYLLVQSVTERAGEAPEKTFLTCRARLVSGCEVLATKETPVHRATPGPRRIGQWSTSERRKNKKL
jgi:hypothetical protein